jgi:hypothetical protein
MLVAQAAQGFQDGGALEPRAMVQAAAAAGDEQRSPVSVIG